MHGTTLKKRNRMPAHDFNPNEPTHFTGANYENGVQKEPCHVKAEKE